MLFTFQKAVNDRLNPAIEFGKSMLLFTAIWYLFLTAPNDAKHRYLIQDRVTGDTYVVEQVPTGIGEPLSLITTLEDKIIAKIEKFVRMQARKYGKLSVITGVCGSKGHLKNKVNIPKWWYKIIFRPDGKVISFLVPNSNNVGRNKVKKYLVNLKTIEKVCEFKLKKR